MTFFMAEIAVADIEASVAWYRDRLGLRVELVDAAKVDSPTPYSRCSNGSAFLKRSSVPGATTSVTGVVRPPDMRTL